MIFLNLVDCTEAYTEDYFSLTIHGPPKFDSPLVKIMKIRINEQIDYTLPIDIDENNLKIEHQIIPSTFTQF